MQASSDEEARLTADSQCMPVSADSRSRAVLQGAVLLLVFGLLALVMRVGLVDDAYIFLRYARNTVDGLGPVFNAGERVEGYTSPLWLALTVPLFALRSDPAPVLLIAGGLIGFATVCTLLCARSFVAALVAATSPAFVFWSFAGLETPLVALLLLATYLLIDASEISVARSAWAGSTFTLAVLTRPDVLWFAPLIGIYLLTRRKSGGASTWRVLAVFTAPMVLVAIHALWRKAYYGDWLPNTYYAKVDLSLWDRIADGAPYALKALTLMVPVATVLLLGRVSRLTSAGAVVIWGFALIAGLGGDHFPFSRFAVPMLPIAASVLVPRPTRRPAAGTPRFDPVTVTAVVLCNFSLLVFTDDAVRARREVQLARAWSDVGRWIDANVPENATIALTSVGALPYYAERRTLDMLGLTDAEIARHGAIHPAGHPGHRRFHTAYVLGARPDLIILPASGRNLHPDAGDGQWPTYENEDLRYLFAVHHLLAARETRTLYHYRPVRLPNGTYLDALWLR